jgi:hypothetical protein
MNWFHKLMIVLVAFIAMMTYFAVRSIQTPLDLVTEKYYDEEVKYQTRIDNISNDKQLTDKVKIGIENEHIQISFPTSIQSANVDGKIKLYYAADRNKDQEFKLNITENNMQRIDVSTLKGAYSVQIDWTYLDKSYYTEQKLFL